MSKDAYYFSHDSNARHDPKITAMRSVYGSEGYGWYWMLIEMMREADGYRLEMQGKYTFNAYAMQMHSDCNTIERFVHDCINEFYLFASDGSQFWSESLLRRMDIREKTSEVRRSAANKRWGKSKRDANASSIDAKAMQGKESKRNESKGNEKKEIYTHDQLEIIKDNLLSLCNRVEIQGFTLHDLDTVYSYIGFADVEVIEACIKKSQNKPRTYLVKTLDGVINRDGIKRKEQLPGPKEDENNAESGVQHGGTTPASESITGGQVGWVNSKRKAEVIPLREVSG